MSGTPMRAGARHAHAGRRARPAPQTEEGGIPREPKVPSARQAGPGGRRDSTARVTPVAGVKRDVYCSSVPGGAAKIMEEKHAIEPVSKVRCGGVVAVVWACVSHAGAGVFLVFAARRVIW